MWEHLGYRFEPVIHLFYVLIAGSMLALMLMMVLSGMDMRYVPYLAGLAAFYNALACLRTFTTLSQKKVVKGLGLLGLSLFCAAFALFAAKCL